ncbi:MAG: DNA alkylation repair enzyme [Candidatus Berkelbacteria bacterium Licking1014_7]|uniref:DNA alkylation repair enzyme n=1 Tax=Candidatus Berkelbacteria bacterium Licking1014_7 TaxID=2017147 RepID=A0A554LJ11_9BACT|nr:MAG: DNA alkylation repair enzyme [Candidatus Berkelbacteria bacterium Licking1014_7]
MENYHESKPELDIVKSIKNDLKKLADPKKAQKLQRFFKTEKGGYGEGDKFIGVTVPDQRKVAQKYWKAANLLEAEKLLRSPIHSHRNTALFILIKRFQKFSEEQKKIVELYLKNLKFINNWDLVDLSAPHILGAHFFDKDRATIFQLANSKNLWAQRIAIMATFHFVRRNDFSDTFKLAKKFLTHKHDLIHKAIGWMLREIGSRDRAIAIEFLEKHYRIMPRTMLRYAIEKFPKNERKKYLEKKL